jgi:hypothetical protein
MSVSTDGAAWASPQYPMLRGGGIFLLCLGAGLIASIAFSGPALVNYSFFSFGAALGLCSLIFARRWAPGRPTRVQVVALATALLLEAVLFGLMGRFLPRGTSESVRWLWVSVIVGFHFLPMTIAFGPRFLLLGLACIANAVVGLFLPDVPYEVFGLLDGFMKLGVGAWSVLSSAPARTA